MKKILISNIGNRNILYQNQIIESTAFRDETEKIWQNFEQEKDKITVQIIPNHIDNETSEIVLVSTSQENINYNFQDTVFEGKILKSLIEERHNIPVEINEFKGNPTNENEIFPFYSSLIRKTISNEDNYMLIFNDAGGTPQMKLVVKELLDYYLPKEQYKIVYSDQRDEKKEIERVYKNKYILLKIARSFVEEFNYEAALRVLNEIPGDAGVNSNLKDLIWLTSKRINFELKDIENFFRGVNELTKTQKKCFEFVYQKSIPENIIGFEPLNKQSRLSIFEIASICQLHFIKQNYTLGIATFYRLCEEFFQRYAKNAGHYDLTRWSERNRFLDENHGELTIALKKIVPEREFNKSYGLPALMLFAMVEGDDKIRNITANFIKVISLFRTNQTEGIDLLRNQCFLAHKNNSVTEDMINKVEPDFLKRILPAIFKAMNMPEENIYNTLNRHIFREFMEN